MRIEIIAIGTELLGTSRLDTNSLWLAERLAARGLGLHRKTVVGDDPDDLRSLFREALGRSDWVICTGGLGPTFDDVTKEVWAELLGVDLVEDPRAREDLLAFFALRQRTPSPGNFKQVLIPQGALVLRNALGTAPGVLWEGPPTLVLLPGVPTEMKAMWESQVAPHLPQGDPILTLRVLVGSVPESTLDLRTQALRARHGHLDWTILSSQSHVEFLLRGREAPALAAARGDLERELGPDLICTGDGSLERTVLEALQARGETLGVAESVTGGLLSARLTAVPGASTAFLGGVVAYTPVAKALLAPVDPLEGSVSQATSRALAEGIRTRLGATWGLGITGNAGPGLDPAGRAPLGALFIALAGPGGTQDLSFMAGGTRADIQIRAASWALDFLRRQLLMPH
jgi:nicotinamide-nucleotide amidase